MTLEANGFSTTQWHALAALKMIEQPISVDMIAVLSQLLPSQLNQLINFCLENNYLIETSPDHYELSNDIPPEITNELSSVCNEELASSFLERLTHSELSDSMDIGLQADLYYQAGKVEEAATIKNELGYKALENRQLGTALKKFEKTLEWIPVPGKSLKQEVLFTSAVLELSHLRFCSGEKIGEIPRVLNMALDIAKKRKNRQNKVLLELHLARHIVNEIKLEDAIKTTRLALDEAKALGDEFLSQLAEFSGLYFFFQGQYKEALTFFEEAVQRVELKRQKPVAFFLSHWLGLCAAYTGQFHRAIGVLDCKWRRASQRAEWALADNYRGDLGIVLLIAGKTEEAHVHLTEMLESATEKKNPNAIYLGRMGLSYYHFLENRPKESHRLMRLAVKDGKEHNILFRQYSWPWFLEMLYGFNRLNYEPIEEFSYERELEKKANGLNVTLKGVALRLKAKEAAYKHSNLESVEALFEESVQHLKKSGNPIELGKTWVEMARFRLRRKEFEPAWNLALMAWEFLTGFNTALFPSDLRPALERNIDKPILFKTPRNSLENVIDSLDKLVLSHNIESFLQKILIIVGNFFGAGRGAVFWENEQKKRELIYKVGFNLSDEEVVSDEFRTGFASVLKSVKQNSVGLEKKPAGTSKNPKFDILATLCIPLKIGEGVQGVLYYDNSYDNEAFDILTEDELDNLTLYLSRLIGSVTSYFKSIMESSYEKAAQTSTAFFSTNDELKAENQNMLKMLSMADKAADSDASILILGETGVGKELLARRLHRMNSQRRNGPFHIVDISNISESLIESELFGYEKGAFTGADQRKIGRLELSDGGTLFIDEVGNIPLNTQMKLLRAIQEKSFVRVGGTKTIHTDFRLLAATNQDLEKDVESGRFRADLFYRINVVPIKIPPLRERGEDIILLAEHYLAMFMKKHGKRGLELSREAKENLMRYQWPGNIRELKNVIERAVLLTSDTNLRIDLVMDSSSNSINSSFHDLPTMDELQRRYIKYVLDRSNGRVSGVGSAAEILGMKRTTLASRMKKLGM